MTSALCHRSFLTTVEKLREHASESKCHEMKAENFKPNASCYTEHARALHNYCSQKVKCVLPECSDNPPALAQKSQASVMQLRTNALHIAQARNSSCSFHPSQKDRWFLLQKRSALVPVSESCRFRTPGPSHHTYSRYLRVGPQLWPAYNWDSQMSETCMHPTSNDHLDQLFWQMKLLHYEDKRQIQVTR